MEENVTDIAEQYQKKEMKQLLLNAIKKLSEKERLFLSLYYYENLNYQEIAQVLGCKVNNVSKTHKSILVILKKTLEENE